MNARSMLSLQSMVHRSATVRMATVLVGGVAGVGLLVGCGDAAAVSEAEPARANVVSLDAEQVRRELIQFENRRDAWVSLNADPSEQGANVNSREHLAHKDAVQP
ncbi:MAG TPA: hypothetical protein VFZ63_04010 [Jiangellaceae bacterium]